jgi:hypothetical protein
MWFAAWASHPLRREEALMSETTMTKAVVFTLLRHAEDFPWSMLDIGLMGLRLDERREYRLHVWNSSLNAADPPIHDHPYNFTSAIIVGELTNTRYLETAGGDEHIRFRYSPPNEEQRRSDTVKLSAAAETLCEGDEYRQLAHELHASWQQPGTVTLVRCSWGGARELTVRSNR